MLKIAIVTSHAAPLRIPVFEKIARIPDVDLQLIFCEERGQLQPPALNFKHVFLHRQSNHDNANVVATLNRFSPDVIVTTEFTPAHLRAFAYACAKGVVHVPMTDGTEASEQTLSNWRRLVRRFVYARSQCFIAASLASQWLYERYGVPPARCFKSCLCIDNDAYVGSPQAEEKDFDFIFCGQMVEAKNPMFALRVAEEAARKLGRKMRIVFAGAGQQEARVKQEALRHPDLVEAHFYGSTPQETLPRLYRSARILLFPTTSDVWGVAANEACAAGLPVIVSPHAGVANELVLDGENGFVCALDIDQWSELSALLLSQDAVYRRFSRLSSAIASQYTFDNAAAGIVAACRHALAVGKGDWNLKHG